MINIAKLLNNTRNKYFYSPAYGKIMLNGVIDDKIYFENDKYLTFNKFGQLDSKGECMVFPSKDMRDWEKYTWKNGNVLTSGNETIIFKWFIDDYTKFVGTYFTNSDNPNPDSSEVVCFTKDFSKPTKAFADDYIQYLKIYNSIKLYYKKGDILYINATKDSPAFIVIYKDAEISKNGFSVIYDYTSYNCSTGEVNTFNCIKIDNDTIIRKTSPGEQYLILEALDKLGYKWNSLELDLEKKDTKKNNSLETNFKPFDKVLVKDKNDKTWQIAIFSHVDKDKNFPYITLSYNGCMWEQCIPYKGNESLLNTNYDCVK